MGRRGHKSTRKMEAEKERNRQRKKIRRSSSYQFSKKNWDVENKISKIVDQRKKVPDSIQKQAKLRVDLAVEKNEFLPNEKYGVTGSYMACVAASPNDSFYYLHKQKNKHLVPKKMSSQSPKESIFEETNCFGRPEVENKCTALVVYVPKSTYENKDFDNDYKICYHNKLAYTCKYANRNVNMQIEYNK